MNDKEFLDELKTAQELLLQCQNKIGCALFDVRSENPSVLIMHGHVDILHRMIRLIRAELFDINLEIEINLNDK